VPQWLVYDGAQPNQAAWKGLKLQLPAALPDTMMKLDWHMS